MCSVYDFCCSDDTGPRSIHLSRTGERMVKTVVFVAWKLRDVEHHPRYSFVTLEEVQIARQGDRHIYRFNGIKLRLSRHRDLCDEDQDIMRTFLLFDDVALIEVDDLRELEKARTDLCWENDVGAEAEGRVPLVVVAAPFDAACTTMFLGVASSYSLLPQRPVVDVTPVSEVYEAEESAAVKMSLLLRRIGYIVESEMIREHRRLHAEPCDYLRAVSLAAPSDWHILEITTTRNLLCEREYERGMPFWENDDWENELALRSPLWRSLNRVRRVCHNLNSGNSLC